MPEYRDGHAGEVSPVDSGFTEERSIGFRVRDTTDSIRVFPRGARVDAPVRLNDETGAMGDEPPGLVIRTGGSTRLSKPDRGTAIAELLRVHDALEKLASEDPPSAELIKLRFFVGLTNEEAAQALGISERSAKRYWTFARAWLYRELQRPTPGTVSQE